MHEFRSFYEDLQRRIKMLLADINTHFIECQMKIQRNTVDQLGRRNALHREGKSSPQESHSHENTRFWCLNRTSTTMLSFPAILVN